MITMLVLIPMATSVAASCWFTRQMLRRKYLPVMAKYAEDLRLCERRCTQLLRANNTLSIRADAMARAVATAEGELARGVDPNFVRVRLKNSTC